MKAVMISIQPKWCELIANGQKTIEVRKTRPKINTPFKVYIYRTTEKTIEIVEEYDSNFKLLRRKKTLKEFDGKVIGEFVCDWIAGENETIRGKVCLTKEELINYCNGKDIYFWHISDLKIYDKPKELGEFCKPCDWNYDCCTCKRAKYELTKAEAKLFYGCDRELTKPPQSWCYVEEL